MKRFVLCAAIILALSFVIPTSSCTSNLTAQDYNRHGMSLAEQGKYEDAVTAYTKAISLNSKDTQFYVNRGIAYLNLKKFDLAIADFNKAIEIDPKLAIAYANRGSAYASKGGDYIKLAIADFNKTIELSKTSSMTEYARKMLASLTKTPPPVVVIPQPPVIIDIPPVEPPTPPEEIIDGTQEGTATPTDHIWPDDAVGTWYGTLDLTSTVNDNDTSFESRARGEFSFNIESNEYFRGTGSGTITGAMYHKEMYQSYWREIKGSFNAKYSIEAVYSSEDYNYKRKNIRVCLVFDYNTHELFDVTVTNLLDEGDYVYSSQRSVFAVAALGQFSPSTMELEDGANFEGVDDGSWSRPTLKITLNRKR